MDADNPSKRRLDPFSFPPETNVRFALLILAVCMFTVSFSRPLAIITRFVFSLSQEIPYNEAMDQTELDSSLDPIYEDNEILSKMEILSGVNDQLGRLAFPTVYIIITFVLATIIYLIHPGRIRRRNKLSILASNQYPILQKEVNDVANQIGVSPPVVMLGRGLRSQNGQAYGHRKKFILGLGGGVRLLLIKAPARFRALLFHEFAHIANRDIGPTYFSVALWRATIYVVVGPFVVIVLGLSLLYFISILLTGNISGLLLLIVANLVGILVISLIFGIPLSVISLIRAGVLRNREFYADWRASQWGAEKPLIEILSAYVNKEKSKKGLRFHPLTRDRLRVLKDPVGLFRITKDLPFVVGILIAFVITGLYTYFFALSGILLSFLMASVVGFVETALASSNIILLQLSNLALSSAGVVNSASILILVFAVSYLVAGSIGLQTQRETIASLVENHKESKWVMRLGWVAALMTLGVEIGFLIVPPYSMSPLGALIGGLVNPLVLLLTFPWLIVFFIFSLLCLIYIRYSSRVVLGSHVGLSPPKGKRRFLTLIHGFVLSALYFPLLVGRILILYPPDQVFISTFLKSLIIGPIIYLIVFFATWLLVNIRRKIKPTCCPTCGKVITNKHLTGQTCEYCGNELTSWLFVTSLSLKHLH